MNKPQANGEQGLIDIDKDNNNLSSPDQIVNALLLQEVLPELARKLNGVTHGSVSVEIVVHDQQYRLNFNQKESRIPGKPMSGSTVHCEPETHSKCVGIELKDTKNGENSPVSCFLSHNCRRNYEKGGVKNG